MKVTSGAVAEVPEERDEADSDFESPFLILMHIPPVATVTQAYKALTDLQRIP